MLTFRTCFQAHLFALEFRGIEAPGQTGGEKKVSVTAEITFLGLTGILLSLG